MCGSERKYLKVNRQDFSLLSKDQLRVRLGELQKERFNLMLQRSSGQLEKPTQVRQTRRDLARVLTFLRKQGEK